eukprot:CAMPEP_0206424452 /NCGR_PEP_ID=MMETSP0324_2-20121206/3238_1 /ASSEMBLY_ACC=CAM_ASM_000836 /TAXON_ID=2866 /ORGANISM="Crypthecodinium cohnii, Strain Seligo" /LENGTH=424 /DNA_ID=CAMNT_0053889113 /DNA_START=171 /DNA_END=1445 /DNA_ORIENTATION=-
MRHNPLADQIIDEEDNKGLRRNPRSKLGRKDDEDEEGGALPSNMTKKVLQMASEQKGEAEDPLDENWIDEELANGGASTMGSVAGDLEMEDIEVDEEGYVVMDGTTEEDERALAMFLPGGGRPDGAKPAGLTLADVILQKIQEHEAKSGPGRGPAEQLNQGLSPKVIQVYSDIGKWLKHYKSGKIPKAFKVIPSLVNWEEVLSLTSPLTWSPAAMYQATSIFASNLNPKMAQRFFNLVLLPAVRQNIAEHKRLNFHYYRSLRKAIYKPASFFKGIVLPMAQEQCTLREAVLLSSVLTKSSIPAMHSAATIVRLSTMNPWYGTTSILLATLLNKKYALPVQVVDQLVAHFAAFSSDERLLPVVWHRSLLIFVQRYKFDLTDDHRKRIKELLKVHFHESIGHEIRRELAAQPTPGAGSGPTGMDMS